ncbi:MAG: serine hydrolase domain-containing protein [Pseudomonadota bacterium]
MSRLIMLTAILCCAAGTIAAPKSGLPTAKPESVGMSSDRLKQVDRVMQRYIDDQLVPGTVTLVARKGKVVHFKAQGMRDVENSKPMTTDTIFRIASMTKPIASVALMMLYEEGHFQLDDPIEKWLPEFSNMKVLVPNGETDGGTPYRLEDASRPITVKHMLTHTAGLMSSYRNGHMTIWQDQARIKPGDDLEQWTKLLAQLPLNYQPGERWEYSQATSVVGRLVEVMSGMTLDEFLQQRIFAPLEMTDTYFFLPEDKLDRFSAQYRPGPDGKIVLQEAPTANSRYVAEPHTFFSGSGGLVSTAADYVRFQQMMLNGGALDGVRILGRKTVETMFANHIGDLPVWLRGPGAGFGLGYSVILDRGLASTSQSEGSVGWGGAFCTIFWIDPAEELIGIMMTQVRPYTHINIRQDFSSVVNAAIVD